MNRFRTVGLVAICAASLVGACNDDATPTPQAPTRVPAYPDLEGTWMLQPRVSLDCGLASMVVDTIQTAVDTSKRGGRSNPGVMIFTLKGYFPPPSSNRILERSAIVSVNTLKRFTFRGERTYSYGGFSFYLVGEFVDTSSFSAAGRISGHLQLGDRRLGCGDHVSFIGKRIR